MPQISAIIFKKNKIVKVEDFIKSERFHLNVLIKKGNKEAGIN